MINNVIVDLRVFWGLDRKIYPWSHYKINEKHLACLLLLLLTNEETEVHTMALGTYSFSVHTCEVWITIEPSSYDDCKDLKS